MRAYKVKQFFKIDTVKDLVFALRSSLNWDQETFAKRLGVTQRTISRWETGAQMSKELEMGIKIGIAAAKQGLPIDEIIAFGISNPEEIEPLKAAENATPYKTKNL